VWIDTVATLLPADEPIYGIPLYESKTRLLNSDNVTRKRIKQVPADK
jgi:hypothetical protein